MSKEKKFLLIILVFLLFSSLIGFLFWKNKAKSGADKVGQSTDQENIKMDGISEEKGENLNYDRDLLDKAILEKNPDYCEKLKVSSSDDCFYSLASAIGDVEFCQEIKNSDYKTKCIESFEYRTIISGSDVKKCSKLTNEELRSQCQQEFFWQWDDLSLCLGFDEEAKNMCQDIIYRKIALEKGDESFCDNVVDGSLKTECQSSIENKPKDSDNDGLSDVEERSYGTDVLKSDSDKDGLTDWEEVRKYLTDPNDSDTDNDNYSDGDEVKRGFNPNGVGSLK